MRARRVGHVLVDDLMDAPGRLLGSHLERLCQPFQRRFGAVHVELHLAAEKIVWIEITQYEVGVGHRRLRTALPIANRSGVSAGTLRSNLEQTEGIDPRDAAAAGADLDHVDPRDAHRQAAPFAKTIYAVDFELVGLERLAVLDDAELCRRAAHVEGE